MARSGRFLRFITVGLSGMAVDMSLLYLLTDASTLALPLALGKLVAGESAIINNFLWNDRWTFADFSRTQTSQRQKFRRFLKFNLICSLGLLLSTTLLDLIYHFAIHDRYIANFIAIVSVTFCNYWLNLKLSWRVTDRSILPKIRP
jgi:dolichol-phosphate mannosyltransferase